jgi:hypothetical protein
MKTASTRLLALALAISAMMISLASSTNAYAYDRVCIARETAERCKHAIDTYDALAAEAGLIRRQRDESVGARDECRHQLDAAREWELRARIAEQAVADAPSRVVWMGYGAGVVIVAGVVVFILRR